MQEAIKLSPTVFGIIFAAIIGKFFKALGLYGAQRGIRLGVSNTLRSGWSIHFGLSRLVLILLIRRWSVS